MNRILLLSDIHANLPALDAVLLDAERSGQLDQVWSLGDTVGYGPRPNECVDRLLALGSVAVAGNHELAATGSIPTGDFNSFARAAAEWTIGELSEGSQAYIKSLPRTEIHGAFTLVHGSPRNPVWEYVTDAYIAAENLSYLQTAHCLHGHTHVPAAISASSLESRDVSPLPGQPVEISAGRWFVNPGSVGQPRDGDPRACYAVLDPDEMRVVFYRVEYPIDETQRQMEAVGLPDMLIQRLSVGR